MKRICILALLLCFAALIPLTACSPEEHTGQSGFSNEQEAGSGQSGRNPSSTDTDDWIRYEDVDITISPETQDTPLSEERQKYFYSLGSGTLLRWNKTTGGVSSVCPDPLCEHDNNDCDFYTHDISGLYSVINDTIYYSRRIVINNQFVDQLWKYHIVTGKAEKLHQAYLRITSVEAIATGCYFSELIVPAGSNVSEDLYQTELYFIDLNGKVTKLMTLKGFFKFNAIYDDKIWWYENGGGDYVSDLYGKNFSAYDTATQRPKRENYEFFMRSLGFSNGRAQTVLMRTDLNTGEEVQLLDRCTFYTIHGDRIYYLEHLDEPIVLGKPANGTNDYKDSYGGKLYSINFDGGDKKLVVDDETIYFYTLPEVRNSPLKDDRYMGIPLMYYEETAKGLVSHIYRSMLIYDTQTGEYKVSVYEP